ncbi:Flp pilus assembly protein CpaB [Clostridium sp. AM58-1XD]|uniref:Flp pilus assembly protein CpaB n=1 Tax=Clostridium sp. AM58-1XD TaxID=2292307 RepID=UPI000E4B5AAF|nr:Flp pilus assembly protein CpaB [Clostridium sp. AM58-1XD]RGY97915.1 Flp pilus assembly protein CpaB [Clostridium sp. AM58-1XD]
MKKTKLISLLAAIIATIAVWSALNSRKEEQLSNERTRPVVTARVEIPEGTVIEAGMLEVKEVPEEFVAGSVFSTTGEVAKNVAKGDIAAGEQITKGRLSSAEADEIGLAYRIEKGKRAITLEVGIEAGVANTILPGNKVDILETNLNESGGLTTSYLLQQVEVLAVDSHLRRWEGAGVDEYASVTLSVTPEEALLVEIDSFTARMVNDGNLRLLLRPQDDDGLSTELSVEASAIWEQAAAPPSDQPAEPGQE